MQETLRLALNADTTPLSISDTLVFKSFEERAREAAEAGFPAVNVDRGEAGLTSRKVLEIAGRHRLELASGFFQGSFYDPLEENAILEEAEIQAEFSRSIGQDCLFVSTSVGPPERRSLAGRIGPSENVSLSGPQFATMARLLNRIGKLWRSYGIDLCFHPHAATYVEAPHEIDLLMEATDPALVRFGPDTGHILFGGGEPLEIIERYFHRLGALHIKDARTEVLETVRELKLGYRAACAKGVWAELGRGDIDFPGLFGFLREKRWSGWVIVETDHTHYGTALESSRVSREYLRDVIGL